MLSSTLCHLKPQEVMKKIFNTRLEFQV